MDIKKIGDYLSKFSNLTPPDDSLKNHIQELLKEELRVEIKKEDIKITNSIIYLTTPSVVKNEIFLQKKSLLLKINSFSKKRSLHDIK